MDSTPSLLGRLVDRARHLRYKWFGKGPTDAQWEERVRRLVVESVERALPWIPERGARLVDVGANIGVFTELVLARRPDAEAWLFEPVERHHARAAARFAGRPAIRVERLALGDVDAPMTIWKPKHNPGGNLLTEKMMRDREDHMDFRPEPVRCRVFSDWAREQHVERVDFVKIDTEGFDYRVLRGMLAFLAATPSKPAILAELMPREMHHDWEGQTQVLERLFSLGYERVDLSRMRDFEDFLLVPAGRKPIG
jgi:FkbM family methyltransferase